MVLVHSQGADAFDRLALPRAQEEAVAHHVALHAQVVGQAHSAGAADLFQHHMQHQWRPFAQRGGRGTRPVAVSGFKPPHDLANGWQRKILVNIGLSAGTACLSRYKLRSNIGLDSRAICKALCGQGVPHRRLPV